MCGKFCKILSSPTFLEYIFLYILFTGNSVQESQDSFYFITPIVWNGLNRTNRTIVEGDTWNHSGGRVIPIMEGGLRTRSKRSYHYKPPTVNVHADRWLMKEYTLYPPHEVI